MYSESIFMTNLKLLLCLYSRIIFNHVPLLDNLYPIYVILGYDTLLEYVLHFMDYMCDR